MNAAKELVFTDEDFAIPRYINHPRGEGVRLAGVFVRESSVEFFAKDIPRSSGDLLRVIHSLMPSDPGTPLTYF